MMMVMMMCVCVYWERAIRPLSIGLPLMPVPESVTGAIFL